jgi:hypothetical protein
MSDEEAPPPDTKDSVPPESPNERGGGKESRRRRLEGVIPEIVRRAVELGVEKAQEAPDNLKQFVGDLKLPKEIAHYLLAQIDETKNGLVRVVAKEIRDFLEHTNFAGEVQKLLTTVQFEVNTTIRFTPNDGRADTKKKASKESDFDDDDDGDDIDDDDDDDDDVNERRSTPLPKPEVKTAVHVRREDRRRRRDRGT